MCSSQIGVCSSERWNGVAELAAPRDIEENELFYALNTRYAELKISY